VILVPYFAYAKENKRLLPGRLSAKNVINSLRACGVNGIIWI
jgi:phosphoribosylpyrophosphate synthetase